MGERQYVLVIEEHGMVGSGPTEDLRAVEQDQSAWEDEAGKRGTIMRRDVGDWQLLTDPEVTPVVGPVSGAVPGLAAVLAEITYTTVKQATQNTWVGWEHLTDDERALIIAARDRQELFAAVVELAEAYYEAGLVEGSMIGDPDVAEVRERGL